MKRTFPSFSYLFALPLALPLVLLLACDRPPAAIEEPPTALWDEIVSQEPFLVVPGLRWHLHDEGGWYFQNRATLLVPVTRGVQRPLTLRLRGEEVTLGHRFRIDWDGEPVPIERVTYGQKNLVVELPPELLQPGTHRLTFHRDHPREKHRARSQPKSIFPAISFRLGKTQPVAVDAADFDRHRRIADFLQHAVTGDGPERRGGLLFVGPASHTLRLPRVSAGKLRLEPRNFSAASARFTVESSIVGKPDSNQTTTGVTPSGEATITVDLEAGDNELVLKVEGDPGGVFLWGMPRVAGRDTAELTPIVLITLDTTRRDALGPYSRSGLTPVLDRFAEQATVFDAAYSTAPWTLPSHASIMTGLYPSRHGAGVSQVRLASGTPTLARLLRDRGYLAVGFSSGDLSSSRFGLAQGFHYYRNPDRAQTRGSDLAGYLEKTLDAHADEPLFLFINYFDAHALYQAPKRFEDKLGVAELREKLRGQPVWDELLSGKMSAWRQVIEGEEVASPEAIAYLKAAYLAEVAWVDHLLGRLFQQLRDQGLYERALIVVTADHGELLGEGGFFSHGARLDPELVEIPFLVKWPGQQEPRRSPRLTSLVDLYPTLLAAIGIEAPTSDGLAIPSAVGTGPRHPYLLLEEHSSLVHPLPKNMRMSSHLFGVQRSAFRQLVWDDEQSCARYNEGQQDGGGPSRVGAWRQAECETDVLDVVAAIEARLGRRLQGEVEDEDEVLDELKDMLKDLGYL